MNDKFDYVYDRGHWLKLQDHEPEWTLSSILETALAFFALSVCLVAVIMLFLCG